MCLCETCINWVSNKQEIAGGLRCKLKFLKWLAVSVIDKNQYSDGRL